MTDLSSGVNVSPLVLVTRLQGSTGPVLDGLEASLQIAMSTSFKDSRKLQRSRALQPCPLLCR